MNASYRRTIVAIALFLVGSPAPSHGFESPEHRRVSNIAIEMVLNNVQSDIPRNVKLTDKQRAARDDAIRTLLQFRDGCRDIPGSTYGDFVLRVDMITSPFREFRLWGPGIVWPSACEHLDARLIARLDQTITQWAAAHANADHFQDSLLRGLVSWHRLAVLLAAHEQNLFAALIVNAFADHFLQDFFAPGHIATPRDSFHDIPALAMHDHYNARGAWFVLNQASWPALAELASSLAGVAHYDPTSAAAAVDAIAQQQEIRLFGDNLLHKAPHQELLVALVTARSIADIVWSYILEDRVDTFTDFRTLTSSEFHWTSRRLGARLKPPFACIAYGCYLDPSGEIPKPSTAPDEQVPTLTSARSEALTAPGFWERTLAQAREMDWILGQAFSPPFGLSVDFQTFPTAHASDRLLAGLEVLVAGLLPPGNFLRDMEGAPRGGFGYGVGLAAGYTYVGADGYFGHGPTLRLIFPITDLNLQLSLTGGLRQYVGRDHAEWRPHYGLLFEAGFSLLSARLGIGSDWQITPGGRLEQGLVFSAGLGLALPWSRIERFLGDAFAR